MTIDVLAHYVWGIALITISILSILSAFNKISQARLNYGFAITLMLTSVTYNQLLIGSFDFVFKVFYDLSLANKQHYLIDIIGLSVGLTIIIFAKNIKISNSIKAFGFLIASIILAFHDQGHFGGNNHATWLTPYHQMLALLLFIVAIAHIFIVLSKSKRTQTLLTFISICLFLAGSSLLLYHDPAHNQAQACYGLGQVVNLSVNEDGFSENELSVNQCDVLSIKNTGKWQRKIAFGQHDNHQAYGIYNEPVLEPNDSTTIILSNDGQFKLHDHFKETISLKLIVSKTQ